MVVPTVEDSSAVVRTLNALEDPLRKVANSVSQDAAAVVRKLVAAMEAELRNFEPDGEA
jgi:hypothetical protein